MSIEQFPENDISSTIARVQGIEIYPDIENALTLGSRNIQVDGVLLIAEHGDFPLDDRGV